jgi:hypothetical protein
MAFDPEKFAAQAALGFIPTEELPTAAQDALESGFNGPQTVRTAILDPNSPWEIEQALPLMLKELCGRSVSSKDAALRLARERAQEILRNAEVPLPSLPYFHQLMLAADGPPELLELGRLEELEFNYGDLDTLRTLAAIESENLLSPDLREKRHAEWRTIFKQQKEAELRALFKKRYWERIAEIRRVLWIQLFAWIALGWAFSSWRAALIGFLATIPLMFLLPVWAVYLQVKREHRDRLLRANVAEDLVKSISIWHRG